MFDKSVKTYAKTLYMKFNMDGTRKYSLRKITDLLCEKYKIKMWHGTVQNWALTGGWSREYKSRIKTAISEVLANKVSEQEDLHQALSNEIKETYIRTSNIANLSLEIIEEQLNEQYAKMRKHFDNKELVNIAIKGIEARQKMLEQFRDELKNNEEELMLERKVIDEEISKLKIPEVKKEELANVFLHLTQELRKKKLDKEISKSKKTTETLKTMEDDKMVIIDPEYEVISKDETPSSSTIYKEPDIYMTSNNEEPILLDENDKEIFNSNVSDSDLDLDF